MMATFFPEEMCLAPKFDDAGLPEKTPAAVGRELPPLRLLSEPSPTFNGIALDAANSRILMSDENRKSVLVYDRAGGSKSSAVTSPLRQVIGPDSQIGYIAGVTSDPEHREIYAVNNDLDDRIVVFDDDANGNVKPKRRAFVPPQSWWVFVNPPPVQFGPSLPPLRR